MLKRILPAAGVLLGLLVFAGLMTRAAAQIPAVATVFTTKEMPHILIDAGHGGEDGGAVVGSVLEKQINLAIAQDAADLLTFCGFDVQMTRTGDDALSDEGADVKQRKYNDMKQRLALYNASPQNVVISVHQNKFSNASSHGMQVFYSPNNDKSAVLAEAIRRAAVGMLQPDNTRENKAAGKDIYLLKNTVNPAVLVECGFLSNREEREKLVTDAYQKQVALAIATGLMNYHNTI